ncbi:protein-glutamine glutaminase family protein [Actinacidiphila glaucinigra]|uniref:protein-glutamine glutaminase family protein n=1 Tax=Actinacidiphila glaucinigra TaxID=235986 RepID=UPI003D8DCDF2
MTDRTVARMCFESVSRLSGVFSGQEELQLSDFSDFMAHIRSATEIYEDAVNNPPHGMTRERVLQILNKIPSHRVTAAAVTPDGVSRLLSSRAQASTLLQEGSASPTGESVDASSVIQGQLRPSSSAITGSNLRLDNRLPQANDGQEEVILRKQSVDPYEDVQEIADDNGLAERRVLAAPSLLDTERFDPDRLNASAEGRLAGAKLSVRSDVRRFQMNDGLWVLDLTGRIHLTPQDGVTAHDIRSLVSRLTQAAREGFNTPGFRLPNGDRLHVVIDFLPASHDAHHVVRVHAGPGTTTTTDWYLGNPHGVRLMAAQALHEFAHMVLGLPDRYQDPDTLFRRHPESTAVRAGGTVMAGDPGTEPLLSDEDLSDIQTLVYGGPAIRDFPHPLAPLTPAKATPIPRRTLNRRQEHAAPRTAPKTAESLPIADGGQSGHRSPAAPTAKAADSEEAYVREIHGLLAGTPVNVLNLLVVLERRASAPALYTPSSLESTYKRLFRMTPGEAISEALLAKRLPKHAIRDILGGMGFMDDKTPADNQPLRHIAPPPGRPASEATEVIQYARDVRHALDRRDAKLVMNLLRALDRDTYKVRAVIDAYRARYHTDMQQDLNTGLKRVTGDDHAARIAHALGAVSDSPVSLEQARAWLMQLMQTTFDHPQHGTTPVTPAHPEDGCYLRAHFYANQLIRWGVMPRKVFIAGKNLGVLATTARGATNFEPRAVEWRYHVAPVVMVDKEPMVLDPALSPHPLLIKQWALKIAAAGMRWEEVIRIEGPLPDVHLGFVSDQGKNPSAWVKGWPKRTTIVLTDGYAVGFPNPGAWFPNSWGEADRYVRSKQDRLYNFHIEAERRTLARAISDALVVIRGREYSRRKLLDQLRDLVAQHSPAPDLLKEYKDLDESLRAYLGPYYSEFSNLFPSATAETILAEGVRTLRISNNEPAKRGATSAPVKTTTYRAPRAWKPAQPESAPADTLKHVFLDAPLARSGPSHHSEERARTSPHPKEQLREPTPAITTPHSTGTRSGQAGEHPTTSEITSEVRRKTAEGVPFSLGGNWRPQPLQVQAVLHTRKYPMSKLLGHNAPHITRQLAEAMNASQGDSEAEREQHLQQVKAAFAPIAEEAARHISDDLAHNSTASRGLSLNNTRLVITDISNAPHVALALTQAIADAINNRIYVEHSPGQKIPICPSQDRTTP